MKNYVTIICLQCQTLFETTINNQNRTKFCSFDCRRKWKQFQEGKFPKQYKSIICTKECEYCGEIFSPRRSFSKYCSEKCSRLSNRQSRNCKFCDKEFTVQHKSSTTEFCSNTCHNKFKTDPSNKEIKECLACGEKFETWKYCKSQKYCSRDCARQFSQNKSKWFQIDGITCQGTWELAFLDWALKQELNIKSERHPIPYINDNGKTTKYHPDFWIEEWQTFIDIKSNYTKKFSVRKFELLEEQGIHILVLADDEIKLGVDLSYKHKLELSNQYPFPHKELL